MALTLAYSVTGIKVKDEVNTDGDTLSNAVCQTYWKVVGTDTVDDTKVGEFSGATPFTAASVSLVNFTDFASLTEDAVIGWITAVVEADPGYKSHIEAQIQKEIDATQVVEATMPWAVDDVTPDLPADAVDPE
jgi:hypothetical protein